MTSNTEHAQSLHRDAIVIDGTSFFSEGWHERLAMAGVTALQMTVPWIAENARQAIRRCEAYYALVRNEPRLAIVTSVHDIRRLKEQGQVGFILASQDGSILEDDVGLVEVFFRLGFRVIQLTYNQRNLLGDGCIEPANAGLSRLGRSMIAEFNRVGMQLDLSHVGARTSLEAMEVSNKPVLFTHANPKARADSLRNLTDEQIKMCAAGGGVIGATPYVPMNWTGGAKAPDMDDFIGHVEYIVDLVGIDHVSFGTDSEATPGAYPPELRRSLVAFYPEATQAFREAHPGVSASAGLASMEQLPHVTEKLLERGWQDEDVRKFLGENLLRVYGENWETAQS